MLRRASALCPALALFAVALPVAVAFSPSLPAPAGRFCSSGRLPIAVRPALSAPSPFTYAPGTSARSAALSLRQGLRSAKASGAPYDESLQRLVGLPLGVIPEAADNPWFKRMVREAPGDPGL